MLGGTRSSSSTYTHAHTHTYTLLFECQSVRSVRSEESFCLYVLVCQIQMCAHPYPPTHPDPTPTLAPTTASNRHAASNCSCATLSTGAKSSCAVGSTGSSRRTACTRCRVTCSPACAPASSSNRSSTIGRCQLVAPSRRRMVQRSPRPPDAVLA